MKRKLIVLFVLLNSTIVLYAQYANVKLGDIIDNNGIKGIVFKVNETGDHGTMMSIDVFRSNKQVWFKKKSYYEDLKLSDNNGKNNMQEIYDYAKQNNINLDNFPAIAWCISLGDGWYIPSVAQMTEFYQYYYKGSCAVVDSENPMMLDWEEDDEDKDILASPLSNIEDLQASIGLNPEDMVIDEDMAASHMSSLENMGIDKNMLENIKAYIGDKDTPTEPQKDIIDKIIVDAGGIPISIVPPTPLTKEFGEEVAKCMYFMDGFSSARAFFDF